MNIIHLRLRNAFLTTIIRIRQRHERFARLLADRPTGIRVATRSKSRQVDLRLGYRRNLAIATSISAVFSLAVSLAFPAFEIRAARAKAEQIVIEVQDLPETRQLAKPPPPPRPAVPVETESEDVPADITIEETDLVFDEALTDLPPPPLQAAPGMGEEEPVEFWKVEQKPKLTKQVAPRYPEAARRAGLEGIVLVRILVGKDGKVKRGTVIKGRAIFRAPALAAALQFEFSPALQNARPVPVWINMPLRFTLAR